MNKSGFNVRMQGSDHAELEFYGVIAQIPSFFEDDDFVRPVEVLKFFKEMGKVDRLSIYMNSPGGDVYDGFQIANRIDKLREDGQVKTVETIAEGMVASAATLVFLKGSRRVMRNGSRFMIHEPYTLPRDGMNSTEMRAAADRMDQTKDEALALYETMSTMTRAEIETAMKSETFYTPKEAMAAGFATEVIEPYAIAAKMSTRLRETFQHLPDDVEVIDPAAMANQDEVEQGRAWLASKESLLTST
jgi:ATP-dependent protease ClpP protease subunit